MLNRRLLAALFCALLAALLSFSGAALAGEECFTDRVELYAEGCLPNDPPTLVSPFSADSFDSYITEQLSALSAEIDVSSFKLSKTEFRTTYQRFLNAHPEFFYVGSGYSYYSNSSYITRILPNYRYTGDTLTEMQAIYHAGVDDIVAYAMEADTAVGRLLRANDYMCVRFRFDSTYTIYSPELLFKYGSGLCHAYMLAYRAVLNELGIPNIAVSSVEIDHTWNMVYLDGSWYHIDVTWNDPVSDVPLRAHHTNFLLSDAGISKTGHTGWNDGLDTVVAADNPQYDDFFWTNLIQAAVMQGDVIYYAETGCTATDRVVSAYDLTTGLKSRVYSYDIGQESCYTNLNPLWVEGGTLYYAVRDLLCSVPLEGGAAAPVYSTGDSEQWIWYPFRTGLTLEMYVSDSPGGGGSIHSYAVLPDETLIADLTLDQTVVRMEPGETIRLNAAMSPAPETAYALSWSTSDTSIAFADACGLVRAAGPGVAVITAKYNEHASASCTVIVHSDKQLILPDGTAEIGSEAFAGAAAEMVVLPDGVTSIGSKAFADSESLLLIILPDDIAAIAPDAFAGSPNVTILCRKNTFGEQFAASGGIPCAIIP